jgi:glutamine phosphoribosylpyrophosphate amidotransferase
MSWNGSDEVEVVKADGDVSRNENLRLVDVDDNAMWLVGHVRYATHGSTMELTNNHPIIHGEVIGVHNGVLRNHEEILRETGREEPQTEVDSEAIFAAVNRWGHRAGLRRIVGDMVTVYTKTSKPENLWIARTNGRTLVIARTAAGSLVFASELKVLTAVFGSAKLKNIREVKEQQLLRICDAKVVEMDVLRQPTPPRPPVVHPSGRMGVIGRKAYDGVRGITDRMTSSQEMAPKGPVIRTPYHFGGVGTNGAEASPGLFWYNGQLLTEQEYVDAMERELS